MSIKGATKSKTMGVAAAVMALGMLQQFSDVIPQMVPQEYNGIAVAAIGFVMAVLRWKTTEPLADK